MERQALYFTAPRQVALEREPLPSPSFGQILVQTLISAISPGTELLIYRGLAPADLAGAGLAAVVFFTELVRLAGPPRSGLGAEAFLAGPADLAGEALAGLATVDFLVAEVFPPVRVVLPFADFVDIDCPSFLSTAKI